MKQKISGFLLFAVLISICLAQEAQIVVHKNERILVNYGRSVFLRPVQDLSFLYKPEGNCRVYVLKDEPTHYKIGGLYPGIFPCNFNDKEVRYQHFGGIDVLEDLIRMQARLDTGTETIVKPFTIHVFVQFSAPSEVLDKKTDLIVEDVGGLSDPISNNVLQFSFNEELENCFVRVVDAVHGPPFYGRLVNVTPTSANERDTRLGQNMKCSKFTDGTLRYIHKKTLSSNRDYIPLVVEISDKASKEVAQREFIRMPVRIRRAPENERPSPSYEAVFSAQVDQSMITAITPEVMAAEDKETDPNLLIFNVTKPLGPSEGMLINTDNPNIPVSTFYQKDITDYKIAYKPPARTASGSRTHQIWFEAIDGEGAKSVPFYVFIIVKEMNTGVPKVIKNTGLTMFEGQTRTLGKEVLEITTRGNPENVKISVIGGLKNGQLEKLGNSVNVFTLKDLKQGLVRYIHDDSNTYTDNFVLRVKDKKYEVDVLVAVTIIPKDDEPPALKHNIGMTLLEGGMGQINQFILSAVDIDSDETKLIYKVIDPPLAGGICYQQKTNPGGNEVGWVKTDSLYTKNITEFSQADIILGRVYYKHYGNEVFNDRFTFRVRDDHDIPNQSGLKTFVINIKKIDDLKPKLYPNCPRKMKALETVMAKFTKINLRYMDDDTEDDKLVYKIVKKPFFADDDADGSSDAGKIVAQDGAKTKEVSSFSQNQVNHFKIAYEPPKKEIGRSRREVRFEYDVVDPAGNFVDNQIFEIDLQPKNNKAPRGVIRTVPVDERRQTTIGSEYFNVVDNDNSPADITVGIVKAPKHGALINAGKRMLPGDVFPLQDILRNKIVYSHDGSETLKETIEFLINDGFHSVPVILPIVVSPIDDQPPIIKYLAAKVEVKERGLTTLTKDIISGTDEDTNDEMLAFLVVSNPNHGIIEKQGTPVNIFTQKDILDGTIAYKHITGEIGLTPRTDTLNMTLSDMSDDWIVGGNRYNGIILHFIILPVDSEPPKLAVGKPVIVGEGLKVTITSSNLEVTDVDTDRNKIMCSVVRQPEHGFIESITPAEGSEQSRVGMRAKKFSNFDLINGKVNYVQSKHKDFEPTVDQFVVTCSDKNNTSPPSTINVLIQPSNDEKPVVLVRQFVVVENDFISFDVALLNAIDPDVPEVDLVFYVTEKPKHGELLIQGDDLLPLTQFTKSQLLSSEGGILYQHDGSETKKDSFKLVVSDGVHNVSAVVPVTIIPVDDEVPHVTINTGLNIDRAEMKAITNRNIKVTDLDSDDNTLIYLVMSDAQLGMLRKRVSVGRYLNLTKGSNFTQQDVNSKSIFYQHWNKGNGERDVIRFDVTDGFNRLINQLFYVVITPIDNVHPDVINAGVTLKEKDRITLTTDLLSASDLNSKDENIVFHINKVPAKGYVESTDHPGVPITSFKQIDLAGNKIVYVHTSTDEVKFDNFEFSISDGVNKIHRTFRITLTDVDNKKPILHLSPLPALEGKSTIITPFEVRADDKDTKPENIIFTVTQLPLHGQILKDGYEVISSFSQKDINENRINYRHDGSETTVDSFSIRVTDGTHSDFFVFPDSSSVKTEAQVVTVKIRPVDDKLPVLAKNLGASSLRNFDDGSSGFQLSDRSIQGHDADSDNKELRFMITVPPKHGRLVNVSSPKEALESFKQADINNGEIRYILNKGENATSDMFVFKLADSGDNMLYGQQFYLNWAWVSFSQPEYNVSETKRHITVHLNRRGFLGETSFVSLKLENGTAIENEDFELSRSSQVQFSPGQTKARLKIKIKDDIAYEAVETFGITLVDNIHTLIGTPGNASVNIMDTEDEPVVVIQDPEYLVQEGIGTLKIPLRRHGDLKPLIKVICITMPGTARGTLGSTVTSYRDFISKSAEDRDNIITFDTNEAVKYCPVKIIDDSLFERNEKFKVKLLPFLSASIGKKFSTADVIILPDDNDEPKFTLDKSQYNVDENAGTLDVIVRRDGSDLSVDSSVLFATRQWRPLSARAERDYVPQVQSLRFSPGETEKVVSIIILDDIARPRIEGKENFTILLRAPLNATLGENPTATVTIDDSTSDLPTVYFEKPQYKVRENDSLVTTFVKRRGDTRFVTSVRCYTRQNTSTVGKDYVERPDTNASFVVFKPRETRRKCQVSIINDTMKEPEEQFSLNLGKVFSSNEGGGKIGGRSKTLIKIIDDDQPIIKFMQTKYYVKEPAVEQKMKYIEIPVIRAGDSSKVSAVTVHTRDGSARSGVHYEPLAKEIMFGVNETTKIVRIKIFHEGEKSLRRAFSLYIKPDTKRVAELGLKKTIVYIEEVGRRTGVTFPLKPRVVSLQDYDNLRAARSSPIQGYPLICVTSCNPKFPGYSATAGICKSERINNKLTRYRWQISAKDSQDGVTHDFKNVDSKTFVTDTNRITLDSFYFGPGTRVRCVAQAVDEDEGYGVESFSDPATVDPNEGLCMPRNARDIGAETFSAQVKYTGLKDPKHSNLVRVRILVPHFDGLLPAISTKQLSNFEIALSPDASRVAQHTCSNLLDINEIRTRFGFIKNQIIDPDSAGESQPYQYDVGLRGNATLRFYRNLNLDACLWTFESYYDMTELVQKCGGTITTDGQVKNTVQSHMSIKVPLFVSYIYHSPTAAGGWMHFDHKSSLRLTFVYDTAVLWKDGVGPPATSVLKGNLYPTSIRIRDSDRKLVVNFRTKARFRGQFVMKSDVSTTESLVMSPDQPSLSMTLRLIRSDATYSEPEQMWQFVSNFAVRDYSGQYIVRLLPCTVTEDIEYSTPLECTPRNPITFKLPIRFQQTSEPVAANFSLNTRFFLLNRKQQWLSDKFTGSEVTDVAFTKGSTIYGRVMIDTAQSLGSAYHVVIEKVFLCSGLDGYVPNFDPSSNDFGCLADSTNLLYRFKILDRLAPSTVTQQFDNVRFNANFAVDSDEGGNLVSNPGADGFKLDSTPLFKVSGGRNWFLHTIYTVRSQAQQNRGVGKRSVDYQASAISQHSMIAMPDPHNRYRRDVADLKNIGKNKGTNIQMIRLVFRRDIGDESGANGGASIEAPLDTANGGKLPKEASSRRRSPIEAGISSGSIVGIVLAVLFIVIALAAVVLYKRRKPAEGVKRSASNVSVGDQEGTEI